MSEHRRANNAGRPAKQAAGKAKRRGTDVGVPGTPAEAPKASALTELQDRVRKKGYPNLDVLMRVCETARKRRQSRGTRESRVFEYRGFYIKALRPNENYRMYWQFPNKPDVEHVTLGTSDLRDAEDLVELFVRWLGYDATNQDRDPLVSVVISRFVATLPPNKDGSRYRSHLKWYRELIDKNYYNVKMSEFTPAKQKDLIGQMSERWAVHSARTCMTAFANAVRFACDKDDDGRIFSHERPEVVMSRDIICELLDLDDPDVRNWHPDPAGMAAVLRELASHEAARRWAFLALYTALRPSHILEVNSRMLRKEFGARVLDTRRRRETATDDNRQINGFFRSNAAYIKRHPELPMPDVIYREIESWGDGQWVDVSMSTVAGQINRAAVKLDMPLLIPSSFRDFCKALMQCTFPFLGGADVTEGQRIVWLGHRGASKVHDGYGRFHPQYLRDAADAVVLYMRWLDRESGGVLFRQVSARSVTASEVDPEVDIPAGPSVPATTKPAADEPPSTSGDIEKLRQHSRLARRAARARVGSAVQVPGRSADPGETPPDSSIVEADIHVADDLNGGHRGEVTGLIGSKMLHTGQIEGFQGIYRRVTDGRESGIWGDEFRQAGSLFLLPNLKAWFHVVGVEVYDTDTSLGDGPPSRVFVDRMSREVINSTDIKEKMKSTLGRRVDGWEHHADDLSHAGNGADRRPLEYRDPSQPSSVPRALMEIVGRNSKIAGAQGIVGWFREILPLSGRDMRKDERLDWRYMLRNIQAFFDVHNIVIYEADLIINGKLCPTRLFVDEITEEAMEVEEVRALMVGQLGCDPGGWAGHSSSGGASDFDVEVFIATTSKQAELDRLFDDEGLSSFPVSIWN